MKPLLTGAMLGFWPVGLAVPGRLSSTLRKWHNLSAFDSASHDGGYVLANGLVGSPHGIGG